MDMVLKHLEGTRDPFNSSHPFYILIETSGSNENHDKQVRKKKMKRNLIFKNKILEIGKIVGSSF